jgi:hypothetical protein
METPRSTRRRWLRFSLRTIFLLVTLLCIYLGWAMNWKRQRQNFLDREGVTFAARRWDSDPTWPAPMALRPLGASGYYNIMIDTGGEREVMEAAALFPESVITSDPNNW